MVESILSIIEETIEGAEDPKLTGFQSQQPINPPLALSMGVPFSSSSSQRTKERTNSSFLTMEGKKSISAGNLGKREDASPVRIAVFSHGTAIKCLLRGVLHSDPRMTYKMRIDNTSVTVLKYSVEAGWHLDRVNDICHLVLASVVSP